MNAGRVKRGDQGELVCNVLLSETLCSLTRYKALLHEKIVLSVVDMTLYLPLDHLLHLNRDAHPDKWRQSAQSRE